MPDAAQVRFLTIPELTQELRGGALLLDTRPAEEFAVLHIRGSIQISLMGHFASWAAIIIDPAQNLLLVAEDSKHAQEARNRLVRVGLTQVIGYSIADEHQWRKAAVELASMSVERCEHILGILQSDPSVQRVDVRSRAEWLQGHLPGAISVPLLDLVRKRQMIDPSRSSLVYCREGFRATTASSILLRASAADLGILIDGVEGWSALGLPLETADTESPIRSSCPQRP